jgi:ribosomal protein S18 acetylase RimI-like enzyme
MQHAIDWARQSDEIEKIELRVRSTNSTAIGLYESLGFVREGELARRIKLRSGYANDICMALFVDSSVP